MQAGENTAPRRTHGSHVWFYLPSAAIVAEVPPGIDGYWNWIEGAVVRAPAPRADGGDDCTWLGPYNWTIQTYLYLKAAGLGCTLTATLPARGVVVAHGDFLPPDLEPCPERFVVEIKPDRPLQCRHANFVVVQNRRDPLRRGWARVLVPSAAVNYWPQPGLLPRDPSRGDRFEHVCFKGNPEQFLPEVDVVQSEVERLGLSWHMSPRAEWHDYRQVDAVVAVRPLARLESMSREEAQFVMPARKPATKLYNAWMAGVPAILSPEVGFRELRRSDLDYIEASTVADVVTALARLQADPALRRAMADNGRRRATAFTAEETARGWLRLFERRIFPAYARWQRRSVEQTWLRASRWLLQRAPA